MIEILDFLRGWASSLTTVLQPGAEVEVQEPGLPNGALVVNVDASQTLAQVLLWPSGMLEFRVIAVESSEEAATESREIRTIDDLASVLRSVELMILAAEGFRFPGDPTASD
jgi:hypothetical protein